MYNEPDWLIHQSADVVWKYGRDVPGSALWPKAWVSENDPIGVADFDSLGELVMPCEPTCAVIAPPYLSHPPPGALFHAWSVAVVWLYALETTVITRVAVPVE